MAEQAVPAASTPQARPSVLSLAIKDKASLSAAYMPYLTNGGIFVPTAKPYKMGEELYLVLTFMDDPNKYPIAGKVVWITPANAQYGKTQGIGVHFPYDDSGKRLRDLIEVLLGGTLGSAHGTHTI